MKKTKITIICIFISTINVFGQPELKKISNKNENANSTEIYYVDENNIKEGDYTYIYNKQVQILGKYHNNEKTGNWIYTPNKNMKIIGEYINDQKIGKWIYLKNNDTISILNYQNGKLEGTQTGFNKNGSMASEQNYLNGNLEGRCIICDENGKIVKVSNYKNDILNGFSTIYSSDEKPISQLTYVNDIPVNLEVFNANASKSEFLLSGDLKNGNGTLNMVFNNKDKLKNQVKCTYSLKDSLYDGTISRVFNNGKPLFIGQCRNGYMDGKWQFFSSNGDIYEKEFSFLDAESIDSIDIKTKFRYSYKLNHFEEPIFSENILNFCTRNITYPKEYMMAGIEGKVILKFIVSREGKAECDSLISSSEPRFNAEAIRIINIMPLWIPGFGFEIPIATYYYIPFNFSLR